MPNATSGWRIRRHGQHAGLEMLYIKPGSPWENGFAESFFSRLRDELLNCEEFANLAEARWFFACGMIWVLRMRFPPREGWVARLDSVPEPATIWLLAMAVASKSPIGIICGVG